MIIFFSVLVNNILEVTDFDPVALSRLMTLELRNNKLITTNGIGMLPNLKNLYLVITRGRLYKRWTALSTA